MASPGRASRQGMTLPVPAPHRRAVLPLWAALPTCLPTLPPYFRVWPLPVERESRPTVDHRRARCCYYLRKQQPTALGDALSAALPLSGPHHPTMPGLLRTMIDNQFVNTGANRDPRSKPLTPPACDHRPGSAGRAAGRTVLGLRPQLHKTARCQVASGGFCWVLAVR